MKSFLKTTLAATLGVLLASFISLFIFIGILSALVSSSNKPVSVSPQSILKISLKGSLVERGANHPFNELSNLLNTDENTQVIGLDELRSSLTRAKNDANIVGVYVELGQLAAGPASFFEIRRYLKDFQSSGKWVYAYIDEMASQGCYFAACSADKVFMNPIGSLGFYGLSSTPLFYTDVLKKIGIEPEVFKVGSYKSAVEPFINKGMSPASREQTTAYLNSIWDSMLEGISEDRQLSLKELNDLADQFLLLEQAEVVLASGLIDSLLYKNEVVEFIAQECRQNKQHLSIVSIRDYNQSPDLKEQYIPDKIGVLYASGEIFNASNGYSTNEEIVYKDLIADIENLADNDQVRAVVLRVNSPGGSAFASEQINRALTRLSDKKPLVVSMGDYAASGGYYISAPAHKIYASPTTLTGSIGIFGLFFNAEKLAEKAGLHYDMIKTNTYADFGNLLREMTPGERALMQRNVENGYDLFIRRCAEGRKLSEEDIRKVAEGRVWTGRQAKDIGLVDELAYLDQAIQAAADLAGCERYKVVDYPKNKDFLTSLIESSTTSLQLRLNSWTTGLRGLEWRQLNELHRRQGVMALLPITFPMQ